MGTIDSKGNIKGKVGNATYRVMNGKNIVQSKPATISQSEATKASSGEFGKISTVAKKIRLHFFAAIQDRTDGRMANRFGAALYRAVTKNTALKKGERSVLNSDLSEMTGFEFNNNSPVSELLNATATAVLDADNRVLIKIPTLNGKEDVKWPGLATKCRIKFFVQALDPADWSETSFELFETEIKDDKKHQLSVQQWQSAVIPPGHLCVVMLTMQFYRYNSQVGDISFNSKDLYPAQLLLMKATPKADA